MSTLTYSLDTCFITIAKFSAPLGADRATRHDLQQDNSSSLPQIFSQVIFSII